LDLVKRERSAANYEGGKGRGRGGGGKNAKKCRPVWGQPQLTIHGEKDFSDQTSTRSGGNKLPKGEVNKKSLGKCKIGQEGEIVSKKVPWKVGTVSRQNQPKKMKNRSKNHQEKRLDSGEKALREFEKKKKEKPIRKLTRPRVTTQGEKNFM